MKIPLAVCLSSAVAFAQGDCKKERVLSKPELGFYEKSKGLAKALPPAPKGWEVHPEEVAAPAKLCTDADALYKKGGARLSVVAETEYRDPTDRSAKMDAAVRAGQATPEETKAAAETAKKLAKTDGGAAAVPLLAEQAKVAQAQLDRGNKAMRAAAFDAEARIRISLNPEGESSTGCSNMIAVSVFPAKPEGPSHAFLGVCDGASNPQEPESGLLLLYGTWDAKAEGNVLTATPKYDPKKPHTAVQAMSVLVTADGKRADELMQGVNLKALAAVVGK